jgi:hypothetical protein
LAPDQAYEGLYGQAQNGTTGRSYQQGKYCVNSCGIKLELYANKFTYTLNALFMQKSNHSQTYKNIKKV